MRKQTVQQDLDYKLSAGCIVFHEEDKIIAEIRLLIKLAARRITNLLYLFNDLTCINIAVGPGRP